jgi:hypothetical protein
VVSVTTASDPAEEPAGDLLVYARRARVPRLAFVLLALQMLDLASTWLVLRRGGSEQNAVFPLLGWKLGIALKFTVVLVFGALATVAPHWISQRSLRAACLMYTFVVCWNLAVAGSLT